MKTFSWGVVLLAAVGLLTAGLLSGDLLARGFGGGGGRGGGGGGGRAGGGMARPAGGGGGGARPNFSGGGGARPNMNAGGGRPNFSNASNHSPSFSHPTGGGTSRPQPGGGNRPNIGGQGGNRPNIGGGGGNRPNIGGGGDRPNIGGGGNNRPNIGGGGNNRPNIGGGGNNRPNIGGGGNNRPNIGNGNRPNIGDRTNVGINNRPNIGSGNRTNIGSGNRANVGRIGNTNIGNTNIVSNRPTNINVASNRPYYNNWQHGNWNGNWNGGGRNGYWNGYAHGYNRGYWNGGWGGYWHGAGGGYWGRPWYAAPITWGLGAWAIGSIGYNSGYYAYSNPYYVPVPSTPDYYDYSQPITVFNQQAAAPPAEDAPVADAGDAGPSLSPEQQAGSEHMDLARAAFQKGDYDTALEEIDTAIKSLPKDAALHEFRALVLFATRDYAQAAAVLYAVLSAGPGWDWTTLSGMYSSITAYQQQLKELQDHVKANPEAPDGHFVLAYHYLTAGHKDASIKQWQEVHRLQPEDRLAAQMLTMLGGDKPAESDQPALAASDNGEPGEQEAVPPTPIDAAKIVGKWTAKRPDGGSFGLNLTQDDKFTWSFRQGGGQKQEFSGKYSVDGAVLVLERSDGAQMPGLVTLADNGFNFKLYGGPPDDSGLDFKP